MRGEWWTGPGGEVDREAPPHAGAGLERIVAAERMDGTLERFEAAFGDDPVRACRALVGELLEPVADRAGKPGVVEGSRGNLVGAPTLDRLFPEARFVHAVRDGRDVALAIAATEGDPGALIRGIERWAEEIRAIDAGVRVQEEGAAYGVWPNRLLVVPVCELAGVETGPAWEELVRFLDADGTAARARPDPEQIGALPHRGGWARGLRWWERRRVRRAYGRTLAELAADGVHCAPKLIEALGRRAEGE
jgi:hypothetical protein